MRKKFQNFMLNNIFKNQEFARKVAFYLKIYV
jgi:hypothetical protein